MSEPLIEHEITIEPAFHDMDPMDVVWHGHYFKYFEIARTALLRQIDYDYPNMKESGYAWPVTDCSCRFSKPIKYGHRITVKASMVEYENRLRIEYTISHTDSGTRLCKGATTQIAFDMKQQEACFVTPEAFQSRVQSCLQTSST